MLLRQLRFTLTAQAERVDAVLNLLIGKQSGWDLETSVKFEPVGDIRGAGREAEFRFHLDFSTHDGRIGLHAQLEEVFDTGAIQNDVQFDVVARGFCTRTTLPFAVKDVCRKRAFTGSR